MSERKITMGRDLENDKKWRKENLKRYILDFNRTKDKDVLDHLEKQPSKREYIIGLIRKDMNGD